MPGSWELVPSRRILIGCTTNKDMFSTQDMAVKTIDNAIDALESILEHLKGSELLPESFKEVEQECSFLDRMYNLTPFQCFMLSAMLDNDGAVSFRQLSRLAHCSQLRLYRYRGAPERSRCYSYSSYGRERPFFRR